MLLDERQSLGDLPIDLQAVGPISKCLRPWSRTDEMIRVVALMVALVGVGGVVERQTGACDAPLRFGIVRVSRVEGGVLAVSTVAWWGRFGMHA